MASLVALAFASLATMMTLSWAGEKSASAGYYHVHRLAHHMIHAHESQAGNLAAITLNPDTISVLEPLTLTGNARLRVWSFAQQDGADIRLATIGVIRDASNAVAPQAMFALAAALADYDPNAASQPLPAAIVRFLDAAARKCKPAGTPPPAPECSAQEWEFVRDLTAPAPSVRLRDGLAAVQSASSL